MPDQIPPPSNQGQLPDEIQKHMIGGGGAFQINADDFNAALAKDEAARQGKQAEASAPTGEQNQPPPKPDEKPKEAEATKEDDVPKEFRTSKAADTWRDLKRRHKEELASFQTKIKEYEERLKAPVKTEAPADYEQTKQERDQLRTERQELVRKLEIMDIESSPEFQTMMKGKRDQAMALAKMTVGTDHAQKLEEILNMRDGAKKDEAMEELQVEIGAFRASKLATALVEFDKLDMERQQRINRSAEDWKALMQSREDAFKQQNAARVEAFQRVQAEFSGENGSPFFRQREGDAEFNRGVTERLGMAANIFGGPLSSEDAARASLRAAAFPAMESRIKDQDAMILDLKAEIETLRASKPGVGEGGGSGGDTKDDEPGGTADDYMKGAYARAQRAMAGR